MKRYRVTTRCFGYRKKLWEEGEILEAEDNDIVPIHFELIAGDKPAVVKQEDNTLNTFSGLQKSTQQAQKPKAGFARSLSEPVKK